MKEVEFNYLKDWKVSRKFKELYHKPIMMTWVFDKSRFTISDTCDLERRSRRDDEKGWGKNETIKRYDKYFTSLVHPENPDRFLHIYIWWSIIQLLNDLWYDESFNGIIRVYWEFWSINTTKTNIWKIWKIDILDDDNNIVQSTSSSDL